MLQEHVLLVQTVLLVTLQGIAYHAFLGIIYQEQLASPVQTRQAIVWHALVQIVCSVK